MDHYEVNEVGKRQTWHLNHYTKSRLQYVMGNQPLSPPAIIEGRHCIYVGFFCPLKLTTV